MGCGGRAAGAPWSPLRAVVAVATVRVAAARGQCDDASALCEAASVSLLQQGAAKSLLTARDAKASGAAGGVAGESPPRASRGGELRGRELLAAWARARDAQPALFQPPQLRQEDLDALARLPRSSGGAEASASAGVDVPPGWVGPKPPPPSLWGGPSPEYSSANWTRKVTFPSDDPAQEMNYARPGSGIPEGLWGIWWMDQAGFSSVAKDPSYPYAMAPTAEMLASFGPEMPGSGVDTFGARYENETRCVTPVPMYGGPQWAAFDNEDGESIFALHRRSRNTLSFCYGGEGVDHINIFHKQQLFSSGYVPFDIGAYVAGLVGYLDAGDGFLWQSGGIINMTMEQKPWGWDRVTTVADLVQPEPWVEWALWYWLPPWLWQLVKLALALQKNIVSHYPLLQIIDGEGKPTKYMDEWLAWAKTIDNGGTLQVKFPNPEPPTP